MRTAHILAAALALTATLGASARAQTATEFWPELDVYWRPAEHQRTFLELSASADHEGVKHEGTIGLYQDYLMLPAIFFRGGIRFTHSLRDDSYRETRGVGEATYRVATIKTLTLVNRTRGELRWVNGEYSWRLRDRLHLQRLPVPPRGHAYAPYVTFEAYYDSRYNTISRLGARAGVEAHLHGPLGVDGYIARVDNSRGDQNIIDALGITFRLSY